MIKRIHDFYYNVTDMKRAIAFYTEAFGFKTTVSHDYWTSLDLNGVVFGLHLSEAPQVPKTPRDSHGQLCGGTVTFESDDIKADRTRIEKCGGKILGEADQAWGHMLVFEDLDGNVLKLMNPKR